MATEKLQVIIDGKDNSSKAFNSAKNSVSGLEKSIATMAKVAVPALAVSLGKQAVDAAAAFETNMGNLKTLIGDDTKAVAGFEKGLLDLQKIIPKDPDDLGAAAYQVISAGITDSAKALEVLEASSKLAVAGLGETSEAVDIMTSAINAFELDASNANYIADVFFKSVKNGKTTVAELAQGFGQVAPIANQMGVSLEDLLSSVSAMTTSGMKASVAYTQVRAALSNMLKPTKEMQEAMAEAGITSENMNQIISEKGLTGTFKMLANSVDNDTAQMAKMFGSVEGLNAALMLLNETGDNAVLIQDDMKNGADALNNAFEAQNETYNNQVQLLKNELNVTLVKLGNAILPVVLKVLQFLNGFLQESLIPAFSMIVNLVGDFIQSMKDAVSWVVNFIQKAVDAIRRAKELGSQIKSSIGIGGFGGFNLPGIPGLASGGIVTRPTLAMVGEAGPEAVVPLNKAGSVGGGIVINISDNTLLDEFSAEKIGDYLMKSLKQEIRI